MSEYSYSKKAKAKMNRNTDFSKLMAVKEIGQMSWLKRAKE